MYILANDNAGASMETYQQLGIRLSTYGDHRGSLLARILLTAAFVGAICLITIVIGAASAQYP